METKEEKVSSVEKISTEEKNAYDVGMKDNPHVFFGNQILVSNSVFYQSTPVIKHWYPDVDTNDEEEMTEKTLEVADKAEKYLNRSYDYFAKNFLNISGDHWFEIKQELISRRSLWISKKRYAQWIIYDEGDPVQEPDWKGLNVVRSDFPTAFGNFLEEMLIGILHDKDKEEIDQKIIEFENNLINLDVDKVAKPTGVNKIEEYRTDEVGKRKKGTPVHVKAALCYNELIDYMDIISQEIRSGDKIRWVYLLDNPYDYDQIAYRGSDDPDQIMEIVDEYTDYQKLYEKTLKSRIRDVYEAMDWEMPKKKNSNMSKFFSSI